MVCLFTGCNDALEWVDAFASVSGLPPSDCTLILAELVGLSSTSELFTELLNFERHEAHLDEEEKQQLYNELDGLQDDEADDDDVSERFARYRKVLGHHGFSEDFYNLFRKNLSPTSETRPMTFAIDKSLVFTTRYNPQPLVPDAEPEVAEDEDDESMFDPGEMLRHLFAGGPSMIDKMRLSRPVNPIGWQKMLTHLGFEIRPVETDREEPWYPRFYAFKDAVRHPVFIGGPSKTPYDSEDKEAAEIRDGILELNVLSTADVPMLFWSSPLTIGESHVPYWGEIRVDGKWQEMFMTEKVCRVGDILEVSKFMSSRSPQGYEKAAELLQDKEFKLVNWFMEGHQDPMADMLEAVMQKHRKQ